MPGLEWLWQEAVTIWPHIYLSDLQRYLVFATLCYGVVWILFRRPLMPRRIRETFPDAAQMRREFFLSMRTVLVFSLAGFSIHLGVEAGLMDVHGDIGRYGWAYFAASIILIILAHDAYFYWMHRLMHDPRLFRRIHLAHHRSAIPTPWAAYAFDTAEAVVQAAFLPLFVLIVPCHVAVLIVFTTHMILRNVIGHSGFELMPRGRAGKPLFDWLTTVTHHDQHHSSARWNYGLYFTWWDRWCGTEHPRYYAEFARVTAARQTKAA